jgi:hypothetical protein
MMDAPQQFKYRAFISYSHADEEWAKLLHKSLEACQLVICSRKSARSRWVNEEIKTFKRLGA